MVNSDLAEDYRTTLAELTGNNKAQINLLTILAEDYANISDQIVNVLEEALFAAPKHLKIVILYVIDSILKNSKTDCGYRTHFAKNIVKLFEHVFVEGDEKVRAQLYKLRATWSNPLNIFSRGKLYAMDMRINAIDGAWTVQNPMPSHSNRTTIQSSQRSSLNTSNIPTSNKVIHVNPKFFDKKEFLKDEALKVEKSKFPLVFLSSPTNLRETNKRIHSSISSESSLSNSKLPKITDLNKLTHFQTQMSSFSNGSANSQQPENSSLPPSKNVATPEPVVFPIIPMNMPSDMYNRVPPPPALMALPQSSFFRMTPPPQGLEELLASWATQPQSNGLSTDNPNYRIFVDGKSYHVFYLDGVAVIQRGGIPYRIYFSGSPRAIIIDGTIHTLGFGESKGILIDGQMEFFRFGAPSKELYIGELGFKGTFGGPPIIANINGHQHEISLCGATPDIKIEKNPCYELLRFLRPPEMSPDFYKWSEESKKEAPMDVQGLLQKLQASGIFQKTLAKEKRAAAAATSTSAQENRHSPPPIPSNQRLDNIERRAAPMSSLEQWSMRSLVIRYDSVIERIHKNRVACPQCGIGFKQLYGQAYQNHTDWHLKDMIQSNNRYYRSRPWFMTNEWFTYSETDLINKAIADTDNFQDLQISGLGETLANANSNSTESRECFVCHEKFDEYWDEDDDVWKLRDSVVENGKAYHRICKADALLLEDDQNNGMLTPPDSGSTTAPSPVDLLTNTSLARILSQVEQTSASTSSAAPESNLKCSISSLENNSSNELKDELLK